MSTNASIIVPSIAGFHCIYLHYDGMPSEALVTLKEHYNTTESVEKLMNLGDLSTLNISTDCPEGHSFEKPVKGFCVAYGRDRGEENCDKQFNPLLSQCTNQQYNYLFKNDEWSIV